MCPWVGSHAPSFGRQFWGLPCCMEYLSPQGNRFIYHAPSNYGLMKLSCSWPILTRANKVTK